MTAEERRLVRELADAVLGEREDARLVRPVLQAMLRTTIADFTLSYDARRAANRVADHDLWTARQKASRERA